jgi:hypothetical protein
MASEWEEAVRTAIVCVPGKCDIAFERRHSPTVVPTHEVPQLQAVAAGFSWPAGFLPPRSSFLECAVWRNLEQRSAPAPCRPHRLP